MSKTTEDLELIVISKAQGLTWNEICAFFPDDTPNALRKSYYRYLRKDEVVERTEPKILVIDIESAPLEVYCWALFDQNIGLDMIKHDWSVLSFSAKWLGSPEADSFYKDNRDMEDPRDDSETLKVIHSLMCEADIILGQNSKRFDVKKLFSRFILNGMEPPSSFRQLDTLQIAKKHFAFTSNKLAYLSDKLCTKYKKLDHAEFGGFKLWAEVLKHNQKAWRAMEQYNRFDVLATEELYYRLAPYDKTLNFSVYDAENLEFRCSCGNNEFVQKGYIYTNSGKFVRSVCTSCKKEYKEPGNLLSKEKRKSLKK